MVQRASGTRAIAAAAADQFAGCSTLKFSIVRRWHIGRSENNCWEAGPLLQKDLHDTLRRGAIPQFRTFSLLAVATQNLAGFGLDVFEVLTGNLIRVSCNRHRTLDVFSRCYGLAREPNLLAGYTGEGKGKGLESTGTIWIENP